MVTIEKDITSPSVYELRSEIENRWCLAGALSGALLGVGAALGGGELLSQVTQLQVLTEPVYRATEVIIGLAGGSLLGMSLGASPIGRWRAEIAFPLPKRYYPLPVDTSIIKT